jgi:hypothetical protein
VDKGGTGADFLQALWFPCHSLIPLTAPQSSVSIIQGWCNRPIMAAVTEDMVPLKPKDKTKILNKW